ncbi:MAG TPA: response regulator [Pyrinomonadaceae bacterium]|nr:response regulator [Pyrinomonadaceae bacterium]
MPPTKKCILCVDGNENIVSMLADLIEELGHEPRSADGLGAALLVARRDHVDLCITENHLNDGTGAELAEKIRELAPDVPVIFYSDDPQRVASAEARRAGAQGCVSKLDDITELAVAVRRLLH